MQLFETWGWNYQHCSSMHWKCQQKCSMECCQINNTNITLYYEKYIQQINQHYDNLWNTRATNCRSCTRHNKILLKC